MMRLKLPLKVFISFIFLVILLKYEASSIIASKFSCTDATCSPLCCSSFVAGTQIIINEAGETASVERLKIGDEVLSFDEITNFTRKNRIVGVREGLRDYYFIISTRTSLVKASANHPFYVGEGYKSWDPNVSIGYKRTDELRVKDKVYLKNNYNQLIHTERVSKIARVDLPTKVYTLTVERDMNFFAENFAVHNKSCYTCPVPPTNTPKPAPTNTPVPQPTNTPAQGGCSKNVWGGCFGYTQSCVTDNFPACAGGGCSCYSNDCSDGSSQSCGETSTPTPTSTPTSTPTPTPVPVGPPSNLQKSCNATGDKMTLTWTAGAYADYYSLRKDNKADGFDCLNSLDGCVDTSGAVTSYEMSVVPGNYYDFWIHSRSNSNSGVWVPSPGGVQLLNAWCCGGFNYFDNPAQGSTLVNGSTYTLNGWGRVCAGPAGQGVRDRVDIHRCDAGTWNNCNGVAGNVTSTNRIDTAGYCGSGNPNLNGWTYNWTPALPAGNYTLRTAVINDSATTCLQWSEKNVTIVDPGAPTNLNRSCSASGDQATFSWNPVSGINDYILRIDKYDGVEPEWAPVDRSTDQWICVHGTSSTRPIVPGATYNGWSVQSSNADCSARYGITYASGFVCNSPVCTIQGYKAMMPGNSQVAPATGQTVTLDGDSSTAVITNPFTFSSIPYGNHTVTVSLPGTKYGVGYTTCVSPANCENSTPAMGSSATTIICLGGETIKLYWHYYDYKERYKLKDTSLHKLSDILNFIPPVPNAFDTLNDDTAKRLIIGNSGIVTLTGNSYDLGPNGADLSAKGWNTKSYTKQTNYLANLNSFLDFIKARKKYKILIDPVDLNQIEANTVNIYQGNLTIDDPSAIDKDNSVLLVQGNVTINSLPGKTTLNTQSKSIAIIVTNTLKIHSTIKEMNGIFIANSIDLAYDVTAPSNVDSQLKVFGNLISNSAISAIKRERADFTKPTLFVVFSPKMYFDLLPFLSTILQNGRTIQ